MICNIFSLLFNNLIMLVFHKFLLLFEILYDLLERFFKDSDFAFVNLNFFGLTVRPVLVLVLGTLVEGHIALQVFVLVIQIVDLTFVIVNCVSLRNCLFI